MSAAQQQGCEVVIDVSLVRRLLTSQFPEWAGLPVVPFDSAGTVNAVYRLGEDMAVRLPRNKSGAKDVEQEQRWLHRLAPSLPIAIPVPLGKGTPAEGYPWHWSVYCWLDGENPVIDRIADPAALAREVAEFVTALQQIDPTGGPPAYRSEPLPTRDAATREAMEHLHGIIDTDAATAAWDAALNAPGHSGPARWVHGDLQPGNVLLEGGKLSAVIDFGCMGVADPAVDLIAAWYLLPAEARDVFRTALRADDASWERGRGWALSIALIELSHYRITNPVMAHNATRVIREVLPTAHGNAD